MNEKAKTPIEILSDTLAIMTARAAEAERQRDAAREDSNNWYTCYSSVKASLDRVEKALKEEIDEHENTRQALREALDNAAKKGAANK